MQYEFRGRTLEQAVHNAIERKDKGKCARISQIVQKQGEVLQRSRDRMARLERDIQRLEDEIDAGKGVDQEDVAKWIAAGAALASLIPAVRAVRIAIGAVRAGVTVAQAIRNGHSISQGVIAALAGVAGITYLTSPSLDRKLERLKQLLVDELGRAEQANKIRLHFLEQMHRSGCISTDV